MYFKLAWRNIWRNKVRTSITMAAVFLAVVLSSFMMSIKEGTYDVMIDNVVGTFLGYAQVHADGYWEDKTLDNAMIITPELEQAIANTAGVQGYLPRIESFALAASQGLTKPAQVVGIDPDKERQINGLHERVDTGQYLLPDDNAVMLGAGLAEYLGLGVGDTVVLLGQGYHGANAAGLYPVKAIVNFGSPELSKNLLFMPMSKAAYLFNLEERYTSIILDIPDRGDAHKVVANLREKVGADYEVMDWLELTPELQELIATDRVEGYVFMFILYTVISFGIFGTMLMMLSERAHEFGVLVAVGMKRIRLAMMVWLEVINISLLGAFFGFLGAFPVCYYFFVNPISMAGGEMEEMYEEFGMEPLLQASVEPGIFLQQGIIVLLIATLISFYPLIFLTRLNAIKAMRS
jgi:ABC-type lipoprotein release transport system permease subunit